MSTPMSLQASITAAKQKRLRCAIYTRKSSEEGLDMEFNSMDAQREACEAYTASQKAEGWVTVRDRYDDGGVSGGTLERPALKRLIADVEDGLVDIIVVYKIDRLSRALMDFAKLVEIFDRNNVTFVSVTQSFNTTTSMGRLTLNILLSFAQFEREVIGERIRDKFAASRKRGIWMGGSVPMGYDVKNRKLVINEAEAAIVRMIFERFVSLGSATVLARAVYAEGIRNRRGRPIDKGVIYRLLSNQVYLGKAVHKGTIYDGEHKAIITEKLWDRVQAVMQESPRGSGSRYSISANSLLKGLIYSDTGSAMTMTYTKKQDRQYRYYISMDLLKSRPVADGAGPQRIPAGMVESAVVGEIQRVVRTPEVVAKVIEHLQHDDQTIDQTTVVAALGNFDALWASLFPIEQSRITRLLIDRVTIGTNGIAVDIKTEGIGSIVHDIMGSHKSEHMK